MSPRAAHLALLILSASVSILLALRSRSRPALRASAVACCAFVGLDVGRFVWGPMVEARVWPWTWLDVFTFAAMPGLWGGLLPVIRSAAGHKKWAQIAALTLPPLACLLYAAALLALRHHPVVAERWEAAMQAPRLCVGAWALWVVLRWRKDEGPEANPEPSIPAHSVAADGGGGVRRRATRPPGDGQPTSRSPLAQPSRLIGVVMGLGCGLAAVWGLWTEWEQVRVASALCWLAALWVGWRAR